jgi:hypothetical protein
MDLRDERINQVKIVVPSMARYNGRDRITRDVMEAAGEQTRYGMKG